MHAASGLHFWRHAVHEIRSVTALHLDLTIGWFLRMQSAAQPAVGLHLLHLRLAGDLSPGNRTAERHHQSDGSQYRVSIICPSPPLQVYLSQPGNNASIWQIRP